nr:FAD-dependent oxidoreductase [Nocardioides zeae]
MIVGASVAGIRTAQALRMVGHRDAITLIGEELHQPYDKPPLSKECLAEPGEPVPLLSNDDLVALDVELRLGVRATSLDAERRVVRTSTGESFDYDRLVIATGVTPRSLPGAQHLAGVHTVRTYDDAAAVRASLAAGRRVVVVGGGFIGAEVASAARAQGLPVDLVEPQDVPMTHLFGVEVATEISRLHELNGTVVHAGVGVAGLEGDGGVTGVRLTDGRRLDADLVVVGIGAAPATDWLLGSGLPVDDGVLCDEQLRVIGFPDVYAAGDVARWPMPFGERPVRVEHWTNANEHAALVAATITGGAPPRPQPPYVWSDQYGRRIQIVGTPRAGRAARLVGSVTEAAFVAIFADDDGRTVGALVLDDARTLMRCRKAVAARTPVCELQLGVPAAVRA